MKKKTTKWYSSSANANKLSLTIKGILVALIPAVMIVGKYANFNYSGTDVYNAIGDITIFISTLMIAYGLIRKVYNRYC